jgi:hypothetical protein
MAHVDKFKPQYHQKKISFSLLQCGYLVFHVLLVKDIVFFPIYFWHPCQESEDYNKFWLISGSILFC